MKGLSVRAPWWWAILYCGKDIENRDWSTDFRGRVLLHASKWWTTRDIDLDWVGLQKMAARAGRTVPIVDWTRVQACGGCIVGSVEIVDCVTRSSSAWFMGKYGFLLRDPIAFTVPELCKGKLGFFDVPDRDLEG